MLTAMYQHDPKYIRNFSIIAHIDHGKSTVADRLLEKTQSVSSREMKAQFLDDMELEKERGITIKARPVTMYYHAKDGHTYQMNFIDTPGHVDFSYEVSRSLAACEGALLVVDAAQGVQAQTLANVFLAVDRNLEILPVINKIDLPAANPEGAKKEIEEVIGLPTDDALLISAKTGIGIEEVLEAIVTNIPCPKPAEDTFVRALIFDSHYDPYRGVLIYVRIMSGELRKKDEILLMETGKAFDLLETGVFTPKEEPVDLLREGEVGYLAANVKNTEDIKIGDTITLRKRPSSTALAGFLHIKPVVFAGIYPIDTNDFEVLREALGKLQLNDSSLQVEQETSLALGFGFRCGFLGLLHLEITFERLRREFDLNIISSAPSVIYRVHLSSGEMMEVANPARYPDPARISSIEEPYASCHIMVPQEFLGAVMNLGNDKRGALLSTESTSSQQLLLTYRFPMNEIITDFSDKLKSATKGYSSFDYALSDYEKSDIIKLEIRINDDPVDAFSVLLHRSKAESKGRALCQKLKEVIPRQLFKIPIQAAVGGKIIARETIGALSKNVTEKCYGGDITRKRKLWEKQKKGKKRMREVGKVSIPQEAFMAVLKAE